MTVIAPEHRVVLIRIPKTAPVDGDPAALYTATREWWRLAAQRTDGGPAAPTHALTVLKGHVVAAYAIDGWEQRDVDRRWRFTGRPATGDVAAYVGTDVSSYFPRGAANPLRFVGCEPSASASSAVQELERLRTSSPREARPVAEQVAELVESIIDEPLAHLMFGHRELFHSNLLAWFVTALPDAADAVFGPDLAAARTVERRVDRERSHLDLAIHLPGKQVLAIENKVFAVYDHAQLDRNAEAVASWKDVHAPASLVLLSMLSPLKDPAWAGGSYSSPHGDWRYLSYADLSNRIEAALAGTAPSYEVETMRRYARLVCALSELVDLVTVRSTHEPVDLPLDVVSALLDRRLADALRKLRTRHLAQLLETALFATGVGGAVSARFSNGSPILDWFTDIADDDGATFLAGWQLQGGSFRRCLVLPHLKGANAETRERRIAYAAARPDLFDFTVTDDLLDTAGTAIAPKVAANAPQGFNRYDPDFVYRSKKVPDLTVQQLLDAALAVAGSVG